MRIRYLLLIVVLIGGGCTNTKLERGYRWYKRGATVHAIALFNEYIHEIEGSSKEKDKLALAYFYRGLCNGDLNRNEMAQRDYKVALELYPRFLYAAFNLGVEYMKTGDFENAESMMTVAWDIAKGVRMGMPEEEKLISKSHFKIDNAFLFLYYGMLLLRKNDYETFMKIRSTLNDDTLRYGNKDVQDLYTNGADWFNKKNSRIIFADWYSRTFR